MNYDTQSHLLAVWAVVALSAFPRSMFVLGAPSLPPPEQDWITILAMCVISITAPCLQLWDTAKQKFTVCQMSFVHWSIDLLKSQLATAVQCCSFDQQFCDQWVQILILWPAQFSNLWPYNSLFCDQRNSLFCDEYNFQFFDQCNCQFYDQHSRQIFDQCNFQLCDQRNCPFPVAFFQLLQAPQCPTKSEPLKLASNRALHRH